MKKFVFPLSRVLDWRRLHSRIEEAKLEQLQAELRGIEARAGKARAALAESERTLLNSASVTGAALAALDAFKRSVAAECANLAENAAACGRRIAAQRQLLARKRLDARLLEKLQDRRFAAWKVEMERELEQQAEEAHLSRRTLR